MPTKKKRLPLTLDEELGRLIEDVAELRGIKQTRLVTEILEQCRPQLETIRDALNAVKNNQNPDPAAILTKLLGDSFQNIADALRDVEDD